MAGDIEGGDTHGRQARTGKVIGQADYLRAGLRAFQWRVDRALQVIEKARTIGKIGVAYSGGKDSTVLLDLIRCMISDAPTAFYDSGCELHQTYAVVEYYGVQIIKPEKSLLEMCRYGGYWGYESPTDPNATFNFGQVLIDEPARRFAAEHGLRACAIGLRAEESVGRELNAKMRGELYCTQPFGVWHLCPLQEWTVDDVWAYIASRNLRYNEAYDVMAEMGIPRKQQRLSTVLGSSAARCGRYVWLKRIDPELWNQLAAEFPKIRSYT